MDSENCRHLTVVGLHYTGPRPDGRLAGMDTVFLLKLKILSYLRLCDPLREQTSEIRSSPKNPLFIFNVVCFIHTDLNYDKAMFIK